MGDLCERAKKAIDAASDLAKQLITLATGVIAITISFAKDIFAGRAAGNGPLMAAWCSYLLSIVAGVWGLMAITGTIDPARPAATKEKGDATPILGANVRIPAAVQLIAFVVATGLVAWTGIAELRDASARAENAGGASSANGTGLPPPETIAAEARRQQAAGDAVPLATTAEVQTVCAGQVPVGWIKTNDAWNPTTCGKPTSIVYNVWTIERYSTKPIGAVMQACAGAVPPGWAMIGNAWNPNMCGHPTSIVNNVMTIKRLN
jgi:hypothetical protein